MISHDIAIEQVSRLYNNYNPNANQQAKEAKVTLLIRELKSFTDDSFAKVCNLVMRESKGRSFPTIEDFVSRLHLVSASDNTDGYEFCEKCEQTGYYTVWQLKGTEEKWYGFPYRCNCNSVTMLAARIINPGCVPIKAHNPYPPNDERHKVYNERKG